MKRAKSSPISSVLVGTRGNHGSPPKRSYQAGSRRRSFDCQADQTRAAGCRTTAKMNQPASGEICSSSRVREAVEHRRPLPQRALVDRHRPPDLAAHRDVELLGPLALHAGDEPLHARAGRLVDGHVDRAPPWHDVGRGPVRRELIAAHRDAPGYCGGRRIPRPRPAQSPAGAPPPAGNRGGGEAAACRRSTVGRRDATQSPAPSAQDRDVRHAAVACGHCDCRSTRRRARA